MNKADLKKWSQYCDTGKMVDDMMELLTKYHHNNTEHGVCSILEEYFTQKQRLIELLKKSSHYIGNMRVALDIELANHAKDTEIYLFCRDFCSNLDVRSHLVKKVDEHGKRRADYMRTGITNLSVMDLLNAEFVARLNAHSESLNKFTSYGELLESVDAFIKFDNTMADFGRYVFDKVDESIVNSAAALTPPVSLTVGMKTSRAFNKICTAYGINKLKPFQIHSEDGTERTVYPYDRLFAKYSDMISGHKRKLKFFISVNPLDYLTMSFGVSWNSCHDIDRDNVRQLEHRSYGGSNCAGVISYLLDSASIITYAHNDMPESFEDGKIYRNMFHFDNDLLVQGRVYPQSNDGCINLYKEFREIVQGELAEMLGLQSNKWILRSELKSRQVSSTGNHYKDYLYHNECNISYPAEKETSKNNIVHIGHSHICPVCGDANSTYVGSLVCDVCR